MASLRAQILAAVLAKLDTANSALGWAGVLRNPRDPVGEDQTNAILLLEGGDREPADLTGNVELRWLEFSVGMMVRETAGDGAEALLDAGLVAISDTLLDPADIQLGGLAVGIELMGIGDPLIGRAPGGARVLAGQALDFAVQYMARQGDASTPGP